MTEERRATDARPGRRSRLRLASSSADGVLLVRTDVVRAVGSGGAAVVVAVIDARCRVNGHNTVVDGDGLWWRAPQHEIALRSGLTDGAVRRALARAVTAGVVATALHPMGDFFDKTLSYRLTGSV